ncbi:MAG: heme lyase CcmF/NrfE family subunit [Caldilineaceae bacterium]
MIFQLGYLLLIIALVLSAYGTIAGYVGGRQRSGALVQSSFHAVYAVAALVWAAAAILWYGLLNDHFEVSYVWNHSERALPVFYKFVAIWGGQDGSLLFWTLLLGIFSVTVALFFRNSQTAMMPFVNATMLATSCFFLVVLVFATNPFKLYNFVPNDGQGLSPLLQNYWMVIHPVMLYLGMVGLTVPFAFAVAALASKKLGNEWVRTIRRWTLVPWMFLSAGILMGSQWAYMELGWGGYWAWDPVENASFLPWLTATAFLHSILIQERRGILKTWNMALIGATFSLSILGTFTTRSGMINSVHSFAQSSVGWYFMIFWALVSLGFLASVIVRSRLLRDETTIESGLSREAAFLANNWLFAGIAFATLFGTYYSVFSEILTGRKQTLAAPYFNQAVAPLFLFLLLLMGIGPLLGWRTTSMQSIRTQLTWPFAVAIVFAAVFSIFSPRFFPILGLSICVLVAATIVQEYWRGVVARRAAHPQENAFIALLNLMQRNGQRYGGYIVHLGIVLLGVAVIGNSFYQTTTQKNLAIGESVTLSGFTFTYNGLEGVRASNRDEYVANVTITEAGNPNRVIGMSQPKRNVYDKAPDAPTSEVGLVMRPSEDLYVVLNGWEGRGESATFTIYINPLTVWMWVGGIVIILGTLICIWPHPKLRPVAVAAQPLPVGAGD